MNVSALHIRNAAFCVFVVAVLHAQVMRTEAFQGCPGPFCVCTVASAECVAGEDCNLSSGEDCDDMCEAECGVGWTHEGSEPPTSCANGGACEPNCGLDVCQIKQCGCQPPEI